MCRVPPGRLLACLGLAVGFALVNTTVVWIILHGYRVPLAWGTVLGLVRAADILIALPITVSGVRFVTGERQNRGASDTDA